MSPSFETRPSWFLQSSPPASLRSPCIGRSPHPASPAQSARRAQSCARRHRRRACSGRRGKRRQTRWRPIRPRKAVHDRPYNDKACHVPPGLFFAGCRGRAAARNLRRRNGRGADSRIVLPCLSAHDHNDHPAHSTGRHCRTADVHDRPSGSGIGLGERPPGRGCLTLLLLGCTRRPGFPALSPSGPSAGALI